MSDILTPDFMKLEQEELPDPNGNTSRSQIQNEQQNQSRGNTVEFTEAQQKKFNEAIKKAMGRAGSAHRQRADAAEARVALLEAQLAGQTEGASDAEMWKAKAASETLRAEAALQRERERERDFQAGSTSTARGKRECD